MLTNKPRPASAATLWVENPYWYHLKVNGRAPRNLEELAQSRADYQHRTRLAEIKAMAPKMALLSPFLELLAARGVALAEREITRWSCSELRIQPQFCARDDRLHAALLELGFREVARREFICEDLVTLKHGRNLLVRIDVSKPLPAES